MNPHVLTKVRVLLCRCRSVRCSSSAFREHFCCTGIGATEVVSLYMLYTTLFLPLVYFGKERPVDVFSDAFLRLVQRVDQVVDTLVACSLVLLKPAW